MSGAAVQKGANKLRIRACVIGAKNFPSEASSEGIRNRGYSTITVLVPWICQTPTGLLAQLSLWQHSDCPTPSCIRTRPYCTVVLYARPHQRILPMNAMVIPCTWPLTCSEPPPCIIQLVVIATTVTRSTLTTDSTTVRRQARQSAALQVLLRRRYSRTTFTPRNECYVFKLSRLLSSCVLHRH
jgi:hypothetical protein